MAGSIKRKEKELTVAGKEARKRKEVLVKQKAKKWRKKYMERREKREEAGRINYERLRFWPKKVYRVTLHLDTAIDTPTSSRRGSIDSVTLAHGHSPSLGSKEKGHKSDSEATGDPKTISLSLSYVAREAAWLPRYDLNISSLKKTATITYRAEFTNGTSEVWKDAKVSLSTSQTSFTGLDDATPSLNPWRIALTKGSDKHPESGALRSWQEMNAKTHGGPRHAAAPFINRSDFFGETTT